MFHSNPYHDAFDLPSLRRRRFGHGQFASSRRGLSVLELLVVLTILMALTVLVLPMFHARIATPLGTQATPNEIVTQTSMKVIRDALVGDQGVVPTLAHQSDALPRDIADLVDAEPPKIVKTTAPELVQFNPLMGIGWRGPYLMSTGRNKDGRPTVVDGWGHEFVLQVDFDSDGKVDEEESRYMRVVSAGPNGKIDTPADRSNMKPGADQSATLTREECGDDVVMFISVPDSRY